MNSKFCLIKILKINHFLLTECSKNCNVSIFILYVFAILVPRKLLKEKARNSGKKRYGTGRRRHNGHINGQASFLPKASTFVYERPETTTTTTEPPDQAGTCKARVTKTRA